MSPVFGQTQLLSRTTLTQQRSATLATVASLWVSRCRQRPCGVWWRVFVYEKGYSLRLHRFDNNTVDWIYHVCNNDVGHHTNYHHRIYGVYKHNDGFVLPLLLSLSVKLCLSFLFLSVTHSHFPKTINPFLLQRTTCRLTETVLSATLTRTRST